MKVALIGMMGSGKTEIGKLLANKIGAIFIDLDFFIETQEKKSISELFDEFGEEHFRGVEENALAQIAFSPGKIVLACGGGVVLRESNRILLQKDFYTIWIDVPVEELLNRLEKNRQYRPLLSAATWKTNLHNIYAARYSLYRDTAKIHYLWHKNESVQESVDRIICMLDEQT
jgi:shikimate kinase